MVTELGHFAAILAFLVALCQCVVPSVGYYFGWDRWMRFAMPASALQFALTLFAFLALCHAFINSDFSLSLVAGNSHSAKPLIYRVAGVWGNHEGSMLLWVLVLTLFGMFVACFGRPLPLRLKSLVLAVQSAISTAFFAFILLTSNPFNRLLPPPADGAGLEPLLQDPGLAVHPPLLYLGYVGLSVSFSFAVAALISGRADAAWARWVRPWTLTSWIFLTLGIAIGSWWAYYELGWGGWWFWDPVENASFMPWLLSTALLHSAMVAEKRECLKSWVILLAILAFSLSLSGTFLTRSGIITSVHSFASDPGRGLFILSILGLFSGGSLLLYGFRHSTLVPSGAFALVSRESALILNNILLIGAAFVVFLGTFWPLIAELLFQRIMSVGPQFFNSTFTPFMIGLVLVLPVGAVLPWKRASLSEGLRRMRMALVTAVIAGLAIYWLQPEAQFLAPIGLALAIWLVSGAFLDIWHRIRPRRVSIRAAFARLSGLPGADWGKALAHAGLGISIAGISAVTGWEIEDIRIARPGDSFQLGSYSVRFEQSFEREGPNYLALGAEFELTQGGKTLTTLLPERRHYPAAGRQTTEAAIDMGFWRDIYLVVGEIHPGGGYTVKSYIKPLANWIWLGALVMAAGGLISLSDRRLRIGAGRRARQSTPVRD
ncbi:MAG: heme lyase CcmF/NrfE family subunit [Rhodobacteraceae bacterium]|nr:heme lyase CcmF/NrfE family subunit [Paracoccaceae bacterium]